MQWAQWDFPYPLLQLSAAIKSSHQYGIYGYLRRVITMDETSLKPFVFVLMPFIKEFTDIYEFGIKPVCRDAGAYFERVDEKIFLEAILERVYNQIAKADIISEEFDVRGHYLHLKGRRIE
jgi:hypothetical protein